jgi:hypothetical protein
MVHIVVYSISLSTAVYDVFWVSSKTGNQCCSVSTDGQMMWWDTRKLSEPQDTIQVYHYKPLHSRAAWYSHDTVSRCNNEASQKHC